MTLVRLTNECNLSCEHCSIPVNSKGHMSLENLKKAVNYIDKYDRNSNIILSGGEPFIYPYLSDATRMFALRNIPVHIYTNGVFAEQNTIRKADLNLPESKLSYLIHKKLLDVQDCDFLPAGLLDSFLQISKLDGNTVSTIREYQDLEEVISILNVALTVKSFIHEVEKINFEMPNGKKVITKIEIGVDRFHDSERKRLGYDVPITDRRHIVSLLRKKLGISIGQSQGEYPAYVGNAASFSDFYKDDFIPANLRYGNFKNTYIKYYLKNKGVDPFVTETLEELLNLLYTNNWKMPKSHSSKNFVKERLHMCSCIDYVLKINTDASLDGCTFNILPAAIKSDGSINRDYFELVNIFKNNGGPMGIARNFGMPEIQIYETLMDKGPCGLCLAAMNYKK